MILVVVLMAAASIMAFALLSSASTQSQVARNATASYSAEGLDQSGTNLALYYLMNPDKADSSLMSTSNGFSYYTPRTNVPAMSLADGSTVSKVAVAMSSRSSSPPVSLWVRSRTLSISAPSRATLSRMAAT